MRMLNNQNSVSTTKVHHMPGLCCPTQSGRGFGSDAMIKRKLSSFMQRQSCQRTIVRRHRSGGCVVFVDLSDVALSYKLGR